MSTTDSEQRIYEWCTQKGRGSPEARILAQVYASTYTDTARLIRLADLRSLQAPQRDWALEMIQGYVAGWFTAPHGRAMELMELYGIRTDMDEG